MTMDRDLGTPCARTTLALARGIRPGDGCRCRVCGPSPFSAGGKLGDNFTDLALLADPSAPDVCLGCAALLAGRPGDDPPPLRTTSVLASATADAGHVEYLGRRDIWRYLIAPYPTPHVLSWAVGGQRHHWLRAGLSTPTRLLIGTDEETVEYVPARDRRILDAVHALLASPTGTAPILSRESIRTGHYHPAATVKYGVAEWTRIEAMVAVARPSPLLDMAVALAPVSEMRTTAEEDALMIDPEDERAAELLAYLALASEVRRKDGMMFWGGRFRHLVERFKGAALATCMSRLLDQCRCDAIGARNVMVLVEEMSAERMAETERSLRDRTALIVTLAYERMRTIRDGGGKALEAQLLTEINKGVA
jgi:hypothetical protein